MAVTVRPVQALRFWHEVMVDLVQNEEVDLSARQLAILLTIYLEVPPHTVRGLAKRLNVTKPVITRALDTMGGLDLVSRRRDDLDRRNVIVQRTVKGSLFLDRLSDRIMARVETLGP